MATIAGRSSGLVVEIIRSLLSTLNTISLNWLWMSLSTSSTCAIVVRQVGHQRAGASIRYSLPNL